MKVVSGGNTVFLCVMFSAVGIYGVQELLAVPNNTGLYTRRSELH
jgi:hypothetical protein